MLPGVQSQSQFLAAAAVGGISFVGSAIGLLDNSTSTLTVSLTSLSGGIASKPAEGDFVYASHHITHFNADQDVGVLSPAGYTELFDLYANDNQDANLSGSWKIMTATPDTSVTFNAATNNFSGHLAIVMVFRGVNQSTPIDVTPTTQVTTNSNVPKPPAITTVTDGALLIVDGGNSANAGTNLLGITDMDTVVVDYVRGSYAGSHAIGFKSQATAGLFTPANFTYFEDSTTFSANAATIALRPAS